VEVLTMRRLRLAGLFLVPLSLALLVASAQAGAAKPGSNGVKRTAAPVWTLAMDGRRVAYASSGRVYVWNVATGATSVVTGRYSNAAHSVNAAEIAIAGRQVAWTKREQFGNTEASARLYTAPVAGTARLIGSTYFGGGHTGWIGGVVGSRHVLAVSTWRWNGAVVTQSRLSLITPNGLRRIASGPATMVAASADAEHIAVLRSTTAWPPGPDDFVSPPPTTTAPTVGVYSASGALLSEIALATDPNTFFKVGLSGNHLVVLTRTISLSPSNPSTARVDVYDWTTRTLLHTWPLAANDLSPLAYDLLPVYGRLAVFEGSGFRLHLLDLTTGRDVIVAANGSGPAVIGAGPAAIDSRGLVYAVNTFPNAGDGQPHGKLIFVPMAKLLAMLQGSLHAAPD
jgi:hypothetical protein